jgi:hypothetical protein
MTTQFTAEIFQNPYLPQGTTEVNAIMTIVSSNTAENVVAPSGDRVFGIICDISGSMQGSKIQAAKQAMIQLVTMMPADNHFFVVVGATVAKTIVPPVLASEVNKHLHFQMAQGRNGGVSEVPHWNASGIAANRWPE